MNEYLEIIKKQQETINELVALLSSKANPTISCELDKKTNETQATATVEKYGNRATEFKNYLIKKGKSDNTIDTYSTAIDLFYRGYKCLNNDTLQKWQDDMYKSLKPKTINLKITAMIEYLKFVGYPEREFKRVKEQKRSFCDNVITEEQYNRFLKWTFENGKMETWKAILTMANTGVRISELIKLKTENLTCGKGYADIISKGNKQRRVYFPKNYVEKILPYCDKEYIVTNRFGTPFSNRGIDQLLRRHGKAAGLPKEVCHAHAFRHFFAKEFLKHNNDITLLGDLLGHSNVATTSIYTRMSTEEQMNKINGIVNW